MNILARVKVWTFSMSGYLYLGRHWHSRRSNRGPGEWREKKGEEIRVVIKVRHSVTVGEQFACRSASRDKTLSTLNYFSCSGCNVDVRTNVHRSPQHWRHSGASHSHTMCVVSSAVKHCNSKLTVACQKYIACHNTHSPNLPYSKGIGSHAAAIPVLKVV